MSEFAPYFWEGEKQTPQGMRYRIRLAEHVLYASDDNSTAGKMGKPETGHPNRKPEATMFSYSYLGGWHNESASETPEATERPVIFAYNGGPGAASAWLHMGLLGPELVDVEGYPDTLERPAKYRLVSNPNFLLDRYDIVLIDPVGTGWARLLDEEAASRHYSTAGDARDFADFICTWLRENNREKSPVYLLGESYGTIRNVALADVLPESVDLQGIIHIGTSLNVGARTTLVVEPNVRRLGANAAVCWYHHHQDDCDRDTFVKDAMDFAYGDYAHALLMGNRLPVESRKSVLERLATFTGMDSGFLDEHKLRFGEVDFLLGCCPGAVVSTYDARLLYRPEASEKYSENTMASAGIIEPDMSQDAFMAAVGPVYDQALAEYIARELCPPDRAMATDMMNIALQWDYRGYEKDTLTLPVELMTRRPNVRMLFVNGYYDLQSTFDFVTYYLSRFDLPADRVVQAVLPSGHASYIGDGMVEELAAELRAFIEQDPQ
jgi:carboxypeptidase C (cathepsin A)